MNCASSFLWPLVKPNIVQFRAGGRSGQPAAVHRCTRSTAQRQVEEHVLSSVNRPRRGFSAVRVGAGKVVNGHLVGIEAAARLRRDPNGAQGSAAGAFHSMRAIAAGGAGAHSSTGKRNTNDAGLEPRPLFYVRWYTRTYSTSITAGSAALSTAPPRSPPIARFRIMNCGASNGHWDRSPFLGLRNSK